MEWTREQRYRKYKDWDAQTLLNLQAQAATSPYQMHYHIHPLRSEEHTSELQSR